MVESREELDFARDLLGQMLAFGVERNPLDGVETRVQLIPHFDDVAETAFADPAEDLEIPRVEEVVSRKSIVFARIYSAAREIDFT